MIVPSTRKSYERPKLHPRPAHDRGGRCRSGEERPCNRGPLHRYCCSAAFAAAHALLGRFLPRLKAASRRPPFLWVYSSRSRASFSRVPGWLKSDAHLLRERLGSGEKVVADH